ncbi:hypothetical protein ACQ4PT_050149 [Festuca glaucescens]
MAILDLSGNSDMENLPTSLSKESGLQVLILDGCYGLKNIVALGRLPPSLKSFSFDGYGPASQRTSTVELPPKHFHLSTAEVKKDISTSKISLEGCIELDNLFLRGLNNLVELDLSGTAIKILDFKTMVVQVPMLKRLFLIGCKHLRAIIFLPDSGRRKVMPKSVAPDVELMCIDTRAGTVCPRPSINKTKSTWLQLHAIVVDARIAYSLSQLVHSYVLGENIIAGVYYDIHVTSSPVYDRVDEFEETNNEKFDHCDQGSLQQLIPEGQYNYVLSMVGDPPMQAFLQPPATELDRHIEFADGSCYVESGLEGELGRLMGDYTESLHLHDATMSRYMLLFLKPDTGRAHAPALMSQAAVRAPVWVFSFPCLETLHIIHCGDLVHVFEGDRWHRKEILSAVGVQFPKLKTIHLQNLPKLHQICEVKMMAPSLESIKIRGCWGLRRLPSVVARPQGTKKPTVEIEKDVWDALEWDAGHRPDHFEAPVHSCYYKKNCPGYPSSGTMILLNPTVLF